MTIAFCPCCGKEMASGRLACARCQNYPPDGAMARSFKAVGTNAQWVVVGQFEDLERATLAKDGLDSGNIPSVLLPPEFERPRGENADRRSVMARIKVNGSVALLAPREYETEACLILQALAQAESKALRNKNDTGNL